MEVYQNYLSYIPDDVYKLLIDNNILDGLKFPGDIANQENNQRLIDLVRKLGCSVDNHGFMGITGKLHDSKLFRDDFKLNKMLRDYLKLSGAGAVYSGHLGAQGNQKSLSNLELDKILIKNVIAIRNFIKSFNSNTDVKVYGEGVFPIHTTLETSMPEFLNHCASLAGGVDGLVLDLCHSAITAAYIQEYSDSSYNFNHFLDDIKCDKVGIVHLSGGYVSPGNCDTFKSNDIIDPHMPCNLDDFNRLFTTLEHCPNIFRVSNEIAFVCLDRNTKVSIKVYLVEALLTKIAVQSRDMHALSDARDYLLSDTFDNPYEVVQNVKKRYLTK